MVKKVATRAFLTTEHERSRFVGDLSFPIDIHCDSSGNQVNDQFDAWKEILHIVQDGVLVHKDGAAPFVYKLAEHFGARGQPITRGLREYWF
jgi:hypothetical protein